MNYFKTTLLSLLFITSCSTDNDYDSSNNMVPDERPTSQEFHELIDNATDERIQNFEFTVDGNLQSFTSEKGAIIQLNTNCLTDASGNSISGNVVLEFIELYDVEDMVVTNKPTMGLMQDGVNKSILKSGGEFYVQLSQNGSSVQSSCGYDLIVPSSLTGGVDPAMILWTGSFDEFDNLTWEDTQDNGQEQGVFIEGNMYYAFLQEFGWCNIDVFYNFPEPKTTIYVDVPDGYDNTNSNVFIYYNNNVANGLACLDVYDEDSELFTEHYGQVPVGFECYVIFISESNGNYIYAVQQQTIEANEIVEITEGELQVVTEAQLTAIIAALN